jgi:hypothetical protein
LLYHVTLNDPAFRDSTDPDEVDSERMLDPDEVGSSSSLEG